MLRLDELYLCFSVSGCCAGVYTFLALAPCIYAIGGAALLVWGAPTPPRVELTRWMATKNGSQWWHQEALLQLPMALVFSFVCTSICVHCSVLFDSFVFQSSLRQSAPTWGCCAVAARLADLFSRGKIETQVVRPEAFIPGWRSIAAPAAAGWIGSR